jgi:hypothetical protein
LRRDKSGRGISKENWGESAFQKLDHCFPSSETKAKLCPPRPKKTELLLEEIFRWCAASSFQDVQETIITENPAVLVHKIGQEEE